MKTKKEKIEDLKTEFNKTIKLESEKLDFEEYLLDHLSNADSIHLSNDWFVYTAGSSIRGDKKPHVIFHVSTLEDLRKVRNIFPEDKKSLNTLTFATGDPIKTASPFRFKIRNSTVGNETHHVFISYTHNGHEIEIHIRNHWEYKAVFETYTRRAQDFEREQLIGRGMSNSNADRLTGYTLMHFENVKYYGGDVISYPQPDKKDLFEYVIFNGTMPAEK